MVLRLEVGLFNSAYDDLIKRRPDTPKIPDGVPLPLPHRGGDGRRPKRGHEWRSLLGLELELEHDNANKDGSRAGEN